MKEILLKQIKQYLAIEGNEVGGNLHIVLDDGNLEDKHILWCRARCMDIHDVLGVYICDNLLRMTYKEREDIYEQL